MKPRHRGRITISGEAKGEICARKSPPHQNVKVLFVSGCIDDSPVSRAIVEERPEYMQKPFTPAVLVRKVREILDQ